MLIPDRERRHLLQFLVVPRLPYVTRLLLAAGLIASGAVLQLALLDGDANTALVLGAALLLAGNSLLLLKGYDLRPQTARRGEWERTTIDRFQDVRRLEKEHRRWDETLVDLTCVTGFMTLIFLVALPVGLGWLLLASLQGEEFVVLFAVDAAVLLLPHWLTGLRRRWKPVSLTERIDSLSVALNALEGFETPPCQVQPMFLVAGEEERSVPSDARVFVRFPDGPEDFLGMQLQVAINNVQGRRYPYLYAVIVARPSFGLIDRHLQALRAMLPPGIITETDREEDAEVIVVRQRTSKDSGYHTNRRTVEMIARLAWQMAAHVAEARGAARR